MRNPIDSIVLSSFTDPHSYIGQHIVDDEGEHLVITGISGDDHFLFRDYRGTMTGSFFIENASFFRMLGHVDGSITKRMKVLRRIYLSAFTAGNLLPIGSQPDFDSFIDNNIDLLDSNELDQLLPF